MNMAKREYFELSMEPEWRDDAKRAYSMILEMGDRIRTITEREVDVFKLLAKGRSKAYIAEALVISENTVRTHAKHIYTKLDIHRRQELLDMLHE